MSLGVEAARCPSCEAIARTDGESEGDPGFVLARLWTDGSPGLAAMAQRPPLLECPACHALGWRGDWRASEAPDDAPRARPPELDRLLRAAGEAAGPEARAYRYLSWLAANDALRAPRPDIAPLVITGQLFIMGLFLSALVLGVAALLGGLKGWLGVALTLVFALPTLILGLLWGLAALRDARLERPRRAVERALRPGSPLGQALAALSAELDPADAYEASLIAELARQQGRFEAALAALPDEAPAELGDWLWTLRVHAERGYPQVAPVERRPAEAAKRQAGNDEHTQDLADAFLESPDLHLRLLPQAARGAPRDAPGGPDDPRLDGRARPEPTP